MKLRFLVPCGAICDTTNVPSGVTAGATALRWMSSAAIILGLSGAGHCGNYDIYIAAGQSNMDGRAYTNELTGPLATWTASQPDVLVHYTNPPGFQTMWQTMAPGFANGSAAPSNRFGPELSFGAAIAPTHSGRKVAIIKVSRGATSLASDWAPSDGHMYQALENAIDVALRELADRGDTGQVRGMIWHQGESDDNPLYRADYEANLTQFIRTVRNDLLKIPDLPFVIGELAQDVYAGQYAAIREAQINVSRTVDNVGFASSAGLQTSDFVHFDTPSVIVLGQRFAEQLRELAVPEPGGVALFASVLTGFVCWPWNRWRPGRPEDAYCRHLPLVSSD